jgi:hypothetical protein
MSDRTKSGSYVQIAKRSRDNRNTRSTNVSIAKRNDKEDSSKNKILNENIFYLVGNYTIDEIRDRLRQYSENPEEDIGVIKLILEGSNNELKVPTSDNPRYTQGTLILMKPSLYKKIKEKDDKFFAKFNYYFFNPERLNEIKTKSLFFTLPKGEGIDNSICIKKMKEVLDCFKRFNILSEIPEIKVNTLRDPQYQKNIGTITFKEDTDLKVIESVKLFINRLQVSTRYQGRVVWAAILCKNNDPDYRRKN